MDSSSSHQKFKKSLNTHFVSGNFASAKYKTGILQTPFPPFSIHTQTQNKGFKNNGRKRDLSLTPKKEETRKSLKIKEKDEISEVVMILNTTNPLGPDPKDLPKDVSMVVLSSLSSSSSSTTTTGKSEKGKEDKVDDMFSGSVVLSSISPPPSSLPLPTFSLRPKLGCGAAAAVAAAGVDVGATDNLRRLLRLS